MSVSDIIRDTLGKEYKLSKDYVDVGVEGKEKKKILCDKCGNSGFIRIISDGTTPPQSKRCDCRRKQDLAENMERGWKGLVFASRIPKTELSDVLRKNVWITATTDLFKGHFRRVAIEKGPLWRFKVLTDADLVQAWLANISMKGVEIMDNDFKELDPLENDYLTLEHAAKSNKFLCIILGVKSASNKETPNVLMEVLRIRYQLNMPTWIVDQPERPLSYGHLCFSTELEFFLKQWPHKRIRLRGSNQPQSDTLTSIDSNEMPFQIVSRPSPPTVAPSIDHLVEVRQFESPRSSGETRDISSKLNNRARPVKKPKR